MRRELRHWQRQALEVYLESLKSERTSLLWEATPGAGKTVAAMRLCLHQLKTKRARSIVIVVPTKHLKIQWARTAQEFGLHLEPNIRKGARLAPDYHGVVLSYQQIGNNPRHYARVTKQAVAVLDEVHHAGDGMQWGDSLRAALTDCSYILCLSGTAFRSDNNAIPFIRYNMLGLSEPDYVYSYTQAIEDKVCRPTVFFTYGGSVSWSKDGLQQTADFNDSLDRVGRTQRLRAALEPDSGWIEPMLQEAHTMLQAVRQEQANAAGLLVAPSQRHARGLAKLIHAVSGVKPSVILSEDAHSRKRLKEFQYSSAPWLVACNMVSEGVDIPRLRVGIYATTIRTKMYFRQFLGRIVRRTTSPDGVQTAFFYLPADPWLRRLAEEIEQEQRHCLSSRQDFFPEGLDIPNEPREKEKESSWQGLGGVNSGLDSVITSGGQLTLWQEPAASNTQYSLEEDFSFETPRTQSPLSRTELKEAIAREIRGLVSRYHQSSGQPHSHIHGLLNKQQEVRSQMECSEEQLRQRKALLENLLESS